MYVLYEKEPALMPDAKQPPPPSTKKPVANAKPQPNAKSTQQPPQPQKSKAMGVVSKLTQSTKKASKPATTGVLQSLAVTAAKALATYQNARTPAATITTNNAKMAAAVPLATASMHPVMQQQQQYSTTSPAPPSPAFVNEVCDLCTTYRKQQLQHHGGGGAPLINPVRPTAAQRQKAIDALPAKTRKGFMYLVGLLPKLNAAGVATAIVFILPKNDGKYYVDDVFTLAGRLFGEDVLEHQPSLLFVCKLTKDGMVLDGGRYIHGHHMNMNKAGPTLQLYLRKMMAVTNATTTVNTVKVDLNA